MVEHSVLPPSSAARRVVCPGSRKLEAQYPQEKDSPYAMEGTKAHELAKSKLEHVWINDGTGSLRSSSSFNVPPEYDDDEMITGADSYVEYVLRVIQSRWEREKSFNLEIEKKVTIENIHPECFGTPDAYFITETQLHVFDYKYGFNRVEAYENWQLIEYAAGILKNGLYTDDFLITLHIVQPRGYGRFSSTDAWSITYGKLKNYFERLRSVESQAMMPMAPCNPSPECTYCSARHVCQALQQAALTSVQVSKMNTPFELTPTMLGNELRFLQHAKELLDARITGLESQTLATIRNGKRVPGYLVEFTKTREQWKVEPAEVLALGQIYNTNLAKEVKTLTPRQAVKLGLPENIVKLYTERPLGNLKLVKENKSDVLKMFAKVDV